MIVKNFYETKKITCFHVCSPMDISTYVLTFRHFNIKIFSVLCVFPCTSKLCVDSDLKKNENLSKCLRFFFDIFLCQIFLFLERGARDVEFLIVRVRRNCYFSSTHRKISIEHFAFMIARFSLEDSNDRSAGKSDSFGSLIGQEVEKIFFVSSLETLIQLIKIAIDQTDGTSV